MVHNARLQKWISENRESQFNHYVRLPDTDKDIAVPTCEFNIVLQLAHIYGHVLQSGIGLRHLIDYYYLLKSKEQGDDLKGDDTLHFLGLDNIAGAVMWILRDVLGLEEKYLIAPVDEKRGIFLYEEILKGGNFGHHAEENIKSNNRFKKNIQRFKRDMRLMRYFPSECMWEPIFRIYHWMWRLRYN